MNKLTSIFFDLISTIDMLLHKRICTISPIDPVIYGNQILPSNDYDDISNLSCSCSKSCSGWIYTKPSFIHIALLAISRFNDQHLHDGSIDELTTSKKAILDFRISNVVNLIEEFIYFKNPRFLDSSYNVLKKMFVHITHM